MSSWFDEEGKVQLKKSALTFKNIKQAQKAQQQITEADIKEVKELYKAHFKNEIKNYPMQRQPYVDKNGAAIVVILALDTLTIKKASSGNWFTFVSASLYNGLQVMLFASTEEELKSLVPNEKKPYYILRGKFKTQYKLASDNSDDYGVELPAFLKETGRSSLAEFKDGDFKCKWTMMLYQILE